MTRLRLLADEDIPDELVSALLSREPGMDILAVGQPGAPPKGTLDPDLLLAAESFGRAFFSRDKKTIPGHLADHYQAGHHTCGIILLRRGFSLAHYAQDLLLIWHATTADEWLDRTDYIPY
jgi:Domain of unknown function (DUF5615)